MFKCDNCGKVTQPGEKQHKALLNTRNKEYYYEQFEEKYGKKKRIEDDHGKPIYKVTVGYEIVKEISVCSDCQCDQQLT